jgi:kinesin family protein 4/21/27
MIACVSPIEYNLNETINTLRYGARARNIKNRAEANRTEVGWDDLVHLQGLVVKLRKDLETIKRAQSNGIESPGTPSSDEATAQARLQLAQEQQFADSLRSQVQAQNLEIARLIKQVQTYKQGGINLPDTDGMTFSQMVEPIIDEYERTIVHLEAEIERYKAALVSLIHMVQLDVC